MIRHLVRRLLGEEEPGLAKRVTAALHAHPGRDYLWPGNVRELEQAVRRVLLTGAYEGESPAGHGIRLRLRHGIDQGTLSAQDLIRHYCGWLYGRHRSYVKVARLTGLDRRTVKKHLDQLAPDESTARSERPS
jgi:DNA-binding NtrC family response regulator